MKEMCVDCKALLKETVENMGVVANAIQDPDSINYIKGVVTGLNAVSLRYNLEAVLPELET